MSFNRRLSGRLTTGVAYTWGKSIDDGSSERADGDLPPDKRNIRAEMFNAFNHPSFTTVGRTLNTTATGINPLAGNFAIVTDTRDARVVQFALKLTL